MARCKKCAAPFDWAKTADGKPMPVEASEGGNLVIETDLLGGPVARVVPKGEGTHVSHFATCRYAADFRKGK